MELLWLPTLLGLGYMGLCGFTFFMQDHLLYYPDPNEPSAVQLESIGLEQWPSENNAFRGYVSSDTESKKNGVIVVFHGNAGSAWQRNYYLEVLESQGFRVVLAEYPGYGGRPGKLGEKSFVADARITVHLARTKFGGPVYLCGESLGAGVAAAVAADPPGEIEGLILITPWDALVDLAQKYYWYLPVRWLARDRYDNVKNLAGFSGRIAMVLAERDEIVPPSHGLRLFTSLNGPKKLWAIKNASHNTWVHFLPADMWPEIADFLLKEP